jgi:hypothetical protein
MELPSFTSITPDQISPDWYLFNFLSTRTIETYQVFSPWEGEMVWDRVRPDIKQWLTTSEVPRSHINFILVRYKDVLMEFIPYSLDRYCVHFIDPLDAIMFKMKFSDEVLPVCFGDDPST